MADFAPDVQPINMPNYFHYSEPISGVKADTSTGMALSTLGEGIEGVAKLADTAKKQSLEQSIRDITNDERGKLTNQLETLKGIIAPPVQSSNGALTFAEADTPNVPPKIDLSLAQIASLKDALHNGKINDTYYTGQLNSRLQKLRSENPGYLDYIDQKTSQITGMDPANAYYKNLMQDINTAGSKKDAEKNATETLLRRALEDHVPNSDIYLKGFRDGNISQDKAEEFIYRSQSEKSAIDLAEARRRMATGNRDDIKATRTQDFTNEVGAVLANNFNTLVTIPGVDTPQGILDFMKTVAAHPEQYTSAQIRTLDTQLMQQKAVVLTQLQARANELSSNTDANGKKYSYSSDIGSDSVQSILKNQVAAAYDNIHNALSEGGPQGAGLAFWHARQLAGQVDDKRYQIYSGDAGDTIKTFKVLQEDLGPAMSGVIIPRVMGANIDNKLRGLFEKSATEARAQPDFDQTGKPITLAQHMAEADKLQQDGKITAAMKGRYVGNLVNIVDDLKDPKINDKTKTKVVQYLFSPEGQGILNGIKTDYTDPQTGKFVPGKYSVFTRLTAPDVVQSIAKLSNTDPTIGQKYKSYLENEAGSQLFYKELQNLNFHTGHDDLHFSYDSDNHRIALIDKGGKPASNVYGAIAQAPAYIRDVNKIVERINTGLEGLGRVEDGLHGDVNNYLLNFLQHAQVNLGQNWTGLPQKLMDAIAASRSPQRKIDDTFDNLNSGTRK